ncbi:aryl-sulfate sulfotransferase [Haloarcula onubensis]|uniref:Aryl-sulfate sulfotransferase n=1 Tax=Haloarcula onubensis TaxID=2950539 RepID=A0ABU2FJZ3_9EURY|nr:aryl-sulfate sulfotransferase [Halomicroarcula sp. S3CR25-11]MDS0281085.1 aryl-sulfate sulfotransferase [Halomicroarcula sp. S3CR25-11]
MRRRTVARAVLAALVLVASLTLLVSWQATPPDAVAAAAGQSDTPPAERAAVVPERPNATVVTTDPPGGSGGTAAIVAFTADGRTLYHDDTYGNYFDVDPDPPGSRTVLYVAGSRYDDCPAALAARGNGSFEDGCAEVVIERVNLTTGQTERLHTAVTEWDIWHDVDRLDEHRLVVADIAEDRVFTLNTTTGAVEWEWRAETDYDREESGGQPGDWTHVNDVELLEDGRIMASLRNHDRVVFVEPGSGVQSRWTLGAEDAYDTLYEQHNPDYVPEARGGPAVLVADSENNRVVEYQRADGGWHQTWTWQDGQLRWPRDADRLPNGHTLVTDSQGDRVLEVDETGAVVWSIRVPTPYEAERLGTGDESANGTSKRASTDGTAGESAAGEQTTGLAWAVAFVTGPLTNGLLYVAPGWMRFGDLLVALGLAAAGLVWLGAELYWRAAHRRLVAAVH